MKTHFTALNLKKNPIYDINTFIDRLNTKLTEKINKINITFFYGVMMINTWHKRSN